MDKNTRGNLFFINAGEAKKVSLSILVRTLDDFLDRFGETSVVGSEFGSVIQNGCGKTKFERLLESSGYNGDPEGFFSKVLDLLGKADGNGKTSINGITLPQPLLMAILEVLIPGNRFLSIKNVEQLEKAANISVPEHERADMQKVVEAYPVRLSTHVIRQMRLSRSVARQYMPFVGELDQAGHAETWNGHYCDGLLERMYANRAVFLLNMSCPVYCRFCFRKHKESRKQENPTPGEVRKAVEYVRREEDITEILITGGDPFLNLANLAVAVNGLMEIPHIRILRLATRSVSYYPQLFLGDEKKMLRWLKRKNRELRQREKRMELAVQFNHPDEISVESLDIVADLAGNGIAVYVQTPFLKNCSDEGPDLARLFSRLRGAGAEIHYIFHPCHPIHGTNAWWTPVSKGMEAAVWLRAHLSDRAIPRICAPSPIGKIDWNTSGWAVEPVKEDRNFIWMRSPYTPEYFKAFASLGDGLENIRVNGEGTFDIRCIAEIGDESLFLGAKPPTSRRKKERKESESVRYLAPADMRLSRSVVKTGSPFVSRLHETLVEIDSEVDGKDLDCVLDDERITDVIISSENDVAKSLSEIGDLVKKLRDFEHVNAIRLRSVKFNYESEKYTPAVIDKLARLNRLSVTNPQRLEIETQFLLADEFRPMHARLASMLNSCGISVYNNTPLLGGINDMPEEIQNIAHACRKAGIEFHHLYVAGLPIQESWNFENPVLLNDVMDIAARVRREGSGREIPRYVIRTILGEVDFGLTSSFAGDGENLAVKLLPYGFSYFKSMNPNFEWPDNVKIDEAGKPVVPVSGLKKTTGFPLA